MIAKKVVVLVITFALSLLPSAFLSCSKREERAQNKAVTGGGDARRGKQLVQQYGCTACHTIPGVKGPRGEVGPPLDKIARRQYIAGKFTNNVQNMTRWIQNPRSMDPQNAMPNLGVTPPDSRDIAAFLYTLK